MITASGCGVQVKDYGHLLQDDPAYAAKAARIAELTRDVSEVVTAEKEALTTLLEKSAPAGRPLARWLFMRPAPCSMVSS